MQLRHEDSISPLVRIAAKSPAVPARDCALPANGRLALASDLSALERLADEWRELHAASSQAHSVFQSVEWCLAWARHYAQPGQGNEPCVITGYRADKLVFLWPLMKVRSGPFTLLRWLSDPFAQYGDVLVRPGNDARGWCASALGFIRKLKGIDCLRLRHVREDAVAYPFLNESFRRAGEPDEAPFLDLSIYPTEADYEKRYSREQRKRRGRIRKSLSAMGEVSFEILPVGDTMDRAMDEAIMQKRQWLCERGLYSRPVMCPRLAPFLRELSRIPAGAVSLLTSRLKAGDHSISWEIGLRCGGTHFGFITAHDTKFTDASPGRLHMDMSQRQAIRDGLKAFDLMVPNDPHKQSWSNGRIGVHEFHATLSVAGRLYGYGYLSLLRPIVRRFYYSAPQALRARFTRLFSA